jgi:hypothetical protein
MTRTSDASVDKVMQLLLRDRDFAIAATVQNNYADVAARYVRFTGKKAPASIATMTAALQKMMGSGEKVKVLRVLSVPWKDRGESALDTAVRALRAEALARQSDPSAGGAKNLPGSSLGPDDDPASMPATSPVATDDVEETNAFWNSLPGILTGAGAVIGAITGNMPASASGSGGAGGGSTPPSGTGDTMTIVLWILGIAVVVTVAALIIRAVRNK